VCVGTAFLGFKTLRPVVVHLRIQIVSRPDAEKRGFIRAIQLDVESECLHTNSCVDADGRYGNICSDSCETQSQNAFLKFQVNSPLLPN
jgi:hypothetical protein